MIDFDENEYLEFLTDADDMLDKAEESLLAMENSGYTKDHYDTIYRVLHSLKGAAGMLGLLDLQGFMHKVESQFEKVKEAQEISKDSSSHFFKCLDVSRKLLHRETVDDLSGIINEGKGIVSGSAQDETTESTQEVDTSAETVKNVPEEIDQLSNVPIQNPSKTRGKLLVVDDEIDIAEILSEQLTPFGFEAVVKTNAMEALDVVKDGNFDLVISDIKMPNMTGIELLEKVRNFDRDIPFIILSGYVTRENSLEAIKNGIHTILAKPIIFEDLLIHVNNAIYNYRSKKLFNKLFNLFMLHYSEIESVLKDHPNKVLKIKQQLQEIINIKNEIKKIYTTIP
ncbi:MAG: response regulator [Bdellovibrionales bacterium]|nr:response regulator [Bdellovibrionales bacterium]